MECCGRLPLGAEVSGLGHDMILESVHDLIRCQREMTVRLFVQRGNRAIDLTGPAGHVTLGQRRVINGDE